jgi:hypothetical protein
MYTTNLLSTRKRRFLLHAKVPSAHAAFLARGSHRLRKLAILRSDKPPTHNLIYYGSNSLENLLSLRDVSRSIAPNNHCRKHQRESTFEEADRENAKLVDNSDRDA